MSREFVNYAVPSADPVQTIRTFDVSPGKLPAVLSVANIFVKARVDRFNSRRSLVYLIENVWKKRKSLMYCVAN